MWHATVTNNKKLEAAYLRRQRKIQGICWKDKVKRLEDELVRKCWKQLFE